MKCFIIIGKTVHKVNRLNNSVLSTLSTSSPLNCIANPYRCLSNIASTKREFKRVFNPHAIDDALWKREGDEQDRE